jgi:hypothetical protein
MMVYEQNRQIAQMLLELGILEPEDLAAVHLIEDGLTRLEDAVALAAGMRQKLGSLLCTAKRISPPQLEHALEEQQKSGEKLGDVLVRRGWLTPQERDAALAFQDHQSGRQPGTGRLRLGEILIATGQISRSQLDAALERQRRSGRQLGEELLTAGDVNARQLAAGLRVQHRLVSAALAAALSLATGVPIQALAGSSTQSIAVIARVAPWVKLFHEHQQMQLTVTPADVERGYVEVSAASRLTVATNNPAGYILEFQPRSAIFRSVAIHGPGVNAEISAGGGSVMQGGDGSGVARTRVELSYRFYLAEGVRAGSYFWPLLVSVSLR